MVKRPYGRSRARYTPGYVPQSPPAIYRQPRSSGYGQGGYARQPNWVGTASTWAKQRYPQYGNIIDVATKYGPMLAPYAGAALKGRKLPSLPKRVVQNGPSRDVNVPFPTGSGSSTSYYTEYPRKNSYSVMRDKLSAPQWYRGDLTSKWTSSYNTQGYASHNLLGTVDLYNMRTSLVPILTNLNTASIYIHELDATTMITNQETMNVLVDLYQVVPRRDTTISVSTAVSTGISDKGGLYSQVGVKPYMSDLFTAMYHVEKVYHLELGCGRTHIHRNRYFLEKKFDYEVYAGQISTSNVTWFLKDYSKNLLCRYWGMPLNDTTNKGNVGLSGVGLAVITYYTLKYSLINPADSRYVSNTSSLMSITTGESVNPDGSIITDQQA